MSYRDTKEKTARKGRKIKYILLAALVFLVAGLCVFSAINAEYAAFYAAVTKSDAEAVVSRRYLQISSQIEAYPYTLTFLWPFGGENQGETPYDK